MKVLMSSQQRRKNPLFSALRKQDIDAAVERLFDIIAPDDTVWVYNIALRGIQSNRVKHEAYVALVSFVITEMTALGAQPYLCFDSERVSATDKVIHQWASDLFRTSQHSLLYAYLANGIEVPEPEFVRPGSHPCLELADFVAYVTARYYHHRWRGTTVEWDLGRLGNVMYLGFDRDGHLAYHRTRGYPWELFHGTEATT